VLASSTIGDELANPPVVDLSTHSSYRTLPPPTPTTNTHHNNPPQITSILDSVPPRVAALMTAVDATVALLDFSKVRPVYEQVKGLLCCILADSVYGQWVATLAFAYLAYCSMVAALVILRKLDSLSDGCCGCVCFDKNDYQPAPPPLSAALRAGEYSSTEGNVVAQITIGGGSKGGPSGSGSKAGSFVSQHASARYGVGDSSPASLLPSRAQSYDRTAPSASAGSASVYVHPGAPPTGHSMGSPRAYPDLTAVASNGSMAPPALHTGPYAQQGGQQQYPQIWRGSPSGILPLADARAALMSSGSVQPPPAMGVPSAAAGGLASAASAPVLPPSGFLGRPLQNVGGLRSRANSSAAAGAGGPML